MISIDLNCDLGEGAGNDEQLMPLVSSVNIACGGHSGDESTMIQSVRLAKHLGLNIGAHPGFEDRINFGRKEIDQSDDTIRALIIRQVIGLQLITLNEQVTLKHVKPHGALYNMASRDRRIAMAILDAIFVIDPQIALVAPPGSVLSNAACDLGLKVVNECFIDRAYQPDGSLVPRSQPGAVLDIPQAIQQAVRIISNNQIQCIDGSIIPSTAQTLCVHGDGEHALSILTELHAEFRKHDIQIKPFK